MIRQLKFRVGDKVSTPKGCGKISHIGIWREKGRFVAIVFRVNRVYWLDWQLSAHRER